MPQVGIINPGEFSPANSIEIVIWTAVGGRGTLVGPDYRRAHRQCRQELLHSGLPRCLAAVLGALFVCVTLFLPKGIVGTLAEWWHKRPRRSAEKAPVASMEAAE